MFTGRIGRAGWLLGHIYLAIPLVGVTIAYIVFNQVVQDSSPVHSSINLSIFITGALTIVYYPVASYGLTMRRWHDMNKSGWFALLNFVPIADLVAWLFQLFVPGTNESNDYGSPQSSFDFKDVLFGSKEPQQSPSPSQQQSERDQQPPKEPGTYGSGTMQ